MGSGSHITADLVIAFRSQEQHVLLSVVIRWSELDGFTLISRFLRHVVIQPRIELPRLLGGLQQRPAQASLSSVRSRVLRALFAPCGGNWSIPVPPVPVQLGWEPPAASRCGLLPYPVVWRRGPGKTWLSGMQMLYTQTCGNFCYLSTGVDS